VVNACWTLLTGSDLERLGSFFVGLITPIGFRVDLPNDLALRGRFLDFITEGATALSATMESCPVLL
jgi:hypothetical protein